MSVGKDIDAAAVASMKSRPAVSRRADWGMTELFSGTHEEMARHSGMSEEEISERFHSSPYQIVDGEATSRIRPERTKSAFRVHPNQSTDALGDPTPPRQEYDVESTAEEIR